MKNNGFGLQSRGSQRVRPARLLAAIGLATSTLVIGVGSGTVFAAPGVAIEKSTNGVDSDAAPGADIVIGSEVTWEYVVENTGDTDLIDVVVTDDQPDIVITCDVDALAPGEFATCSAVGIAGLGLYTNVGTVSAQPTDAQGAPVGDAVTATDTSHYTGTIGTSATTCYAVSDGPPDNELGHDALLTMTLEANGTVTIVNLGNLVTSDGVNVTSAEALAIERDSPTMYFVDDATNDLLLTTLYTDGTVTVDAVAQLSEDLDVDGLTFQGSVLWGAVRNEGVFDDLITIDVNDGTVTTIGPIDGFTNPPLGIIYDVDDIAWDETTGTLFGVMGSAATNYLIEIDPATGDADFVTRRPATDDIEGLGISDAPGTDGTLFGVTGTSAEFYLLSKETGASALIGDLNAETGREDFESVDCHEIELLEKASVGDTVWLDFDEDGVQGPTELGIEGVTVELLDEDGEVIGTAVTDSEGKYLFPDLLVGSYVVRVDPTTLPAGATQTYDADGLGTPHESAKSLASGENDRLQDFGYTLPPAALGDTVWSDDNADGIQDPGELGVPGIPVTLLTDLDGDGVPETTLDTTTTDPDGLYAFTELNPSLTYFVQFDTPGLTLQDVGDDAADSDADPATGLTGPIDLDPGETDNTIDAGIIRAAIGDTVWFDDNGDGVIDPGEDGIPGVTIELRDGDGVLVDTAVTDPDGMYLFTELPPGDYTVTVVDSTLPADLTQTFDDDGLATPNESTTSIVGGSADLDQDFGYQRLGSIGDTVWLDLDGDGVIDPGEDGIPGVTIELRDGDGVLVDTAVTDADGMYLFDDLPAGEYTVTVVASTLPANVVQTFDDDGLATPNVSSTAILAGGEDLDQDFGYQPLGSIGDTVWLDANGDGVVDPDEDGIPGVTMTLLDGDGNVVDTAVTDADGMYLFEGLPAGDYTVQVDPATLPPELAQTFDNDGLGSPNESSTTIGAGDEDLVQDFGYQPAGSIGDTVWLDADGDGVLDPGEAGLAGVTVRLFDGDGNVIGTATTDANGKYLFPNLPSGNYCVQVDETTLPTGLLQTFSPGAVTIPGCAVFTLGAGEDNLDQDFGYRPPPPEVVLPRTGSESNDLLLPALTLLLLGLGALAVSRRRFVGTD